MANGQFALDLRRAIDAAKGQQEGAIKKVVIDLFSDVIAKSPVDTGRFRGNWQCGINSRPAGTVSTVDKTPAGSGGGNTTAQMAVKVASANGAKEFWLVNNLPYAGVLEYGRANGQPGSQQAPAGMVRISLAAFNAKYGV
jgi:hypothetical protein